MITGIGKEGNLDYTYWVYNHDFVDIPLNQVSILPLQAWSTPGTFISTLVVRPPLKKTSVSGPAGVLFLSQ